MNLKLPIKRKLPGEKMVWRWVSYRPEEATRRWWSYGGRIWWKSKSIIPKDSLPFPTIRCYGGNGPTTERKSNHD